MKNKPRLDLMDATCEFEDSELELQWVLIVDDREENLFALEKVLEETGAEVVRAKSGQEALASSLNHEFALAILDVQMPDMDGYELAEHLRSDKKTKQLPIMFMSAVHRDQTHVFRGVDTGAVDYIVKPYEPRILVSKVNVFLDLDRQKRELQRQVELEKAKSRLENILLSMTDSVVVVSNQFCIETVNTAALSLLGMNWDELVGRPLSTIMPIDLGRLTTVPPGSGRSGPSDRTPSLSFTNLHATWQNKEGRKIPVLLSGSPFRTAEGKTMGTVLVARDRSEIAQLQEEHQQVLQTALDGFWVCDENGTLLNVNEAMCRMSGYSRDELLSMSIHDLEAAEAAEETNAHIGEVLEQGRDRFESRHRCKDGKIIDVEISATHNSEAGHFYVFVQDITDSKRGEKEREKLLHDTRERNKELRGLYGVTRATTETSTMEELCEKTSKMIPPSWQYPGNTRCRVVLDGREYHSEPFEPTRWKQTADIVVDGKARGTIEVYYLEERPTLDEGPFLKEERDLIVGLASIIGSAASRQQAIEEMRASEEKFRALTENSPDWIWEVNTEGVYTYASPTAKDMLGRDSEEVLGKTPFDFMVPEDSERIGLEFRGILDAKRPFSNLVNRILHKDGGVVVAETSGVPFFRETGELAGYRGIDRNITHRVEMEKEIRLLYASIEQSSEGVCIADLEGNLRYVNIVWAEMHGYETAKELVGRNLSIFHSQEQMEDDVILFNQKVKEVGAHKGEVGHIRRDGTPFPTYMFTTVVKEDGKPVAMCGIASDISEKLVLEAHLRQQQKMESIGTLASGVAHEINNPITAVLNCCELIMDDVDSDGPVATNVKHIMEASVRVATIVKGLLSFARQEKQRHSPARIWDIVNGTVMLIRKVLQKDQVEIIVDVPEDLPKTRCRSQQIQQVVMNLLTNARDALNSRYPGYDENKIISICSRAIEREGERWLRTTVEDHGTGISAAQMERIFEPFYTTKSRDKGTGLGLSVSHGIITEHLGELTVESEEGEYTRFHIDLRVNNRWSQMADD